MRNIKPQIQESYLAYHTTTAENQVAKKKPSRQPEKMTDDKKTTD